MSLGREGQRAARGLGAAGSPFLGIVPSSEGLPALRSGGKETPASLFLHVTRLHFFFPPLSLSLIFFFPSFPFLKKNKKIK